MLKNGQNERKLKKTACFYCGNDKKRWATISKIVQETKRPRGTVATILRKFRLRGNVQTSKHGGRPQRQRQEPIGTWRNWWKKTGKRHQMFSGVFRSSFSNFWHKSGESWSRSLSVKERQGDEFQLFIFLCSLLFNKNTPNSLFVVGTR